MPGIRHSVGAPFENLYKKLGSALLGYPVTEVYAEGSVLTQDFEHVRLEVIGGLRR